MAISSINPATGEEEKSFEALSEETDKREGSASGRNLPRIP